MLNKAYLTLYGNATLTIKIDDADTERLLLEEAENSGKSVGKSVEELADEQFAKADKLDFEIPRLDVREHMEVIQERLTEEEERLLAENPDVRPYSHIKDSAKYIHDLRHKPRY